MKSKPFVWILAAVLLSAPAFTVAQEPRKVYRIGYLSPNPINNTFRQRLRELGYIEGQNLVIEERVTKGRRELYPQLAAELVRLKVDLIYTMGTSHTRAAKDATTTIPIVMGSSAADPVRHGLVASLARPGGNVTGVIDPMSELAGKRLQLLKETFPKLSRVAHLAVRTSLPAIDHLKNTKAAASALGLRLQALEVDSPDDLENAFQAAVDGGAEALIVVDVNFFHGHRQRIINLEIESGLPAMHTNTRWVPLGGLMSYTTRRAAQNRRGAEFVDKILKGKKPADLPVEQPTKFDFEINLKTARALSITIPQSVLLQADRLIK